MRRLATALIYTLSAGLGAAAFAYPFLAAVAGKGSSSPPNVVLLTTVLVALSLAALLIEVQGQAVSAKVVSALGVLVAVAAVLRFVETAVPGPGGFSPLFAPIILVGYVFDARLGFLMGTMTMLVSALITGGVGPWLPYQMFAAGWVGLTAGWLPRPRSPRWQLVLLAGFGFGWGLLFGALLNLYSWPLVGGAGDQSLPLHQLLARYGVYYLSTSLVWDLMRALGNAALILVLGAPAVRALTRFRNRFQFQVE
ncbi:MAG: ECF transporter S component [Anaerolineae bacterium]